MSYKFPLKYNKNTDRMLADASTLNSGSLPLKSSAYSTVPGEHLSRHVELCTKQPIRQNRYDAGDSVFDLVCINPGLFFRVFRLR